MQRIEDQIALQIGKWVVKIQIDADKMQKAGWQLFSLIDALQDQTARSLQSAPDIGISVQAEELEDEE